MVLLRNVDPVALELGELFEKNGYELALVGGSVRDMILGRPSSDLDFTTNARPDEVAKLLGGYLDEVWDIGKAFGTIGGNKYTDSEAKVQVEITTYRTDEYDQETRKPLVKYGDALEPDLSRRDFTTNAIALRLPSLELVDPFNGLSDLNRGLLRTPIDPRLSFADDPLRMMRALRFAAQLGFTIEADTAAAILEMSDRMEIISSERIRDEFNKILLSARPVEGIELLVQSGLNEWVIPELDALQMATDPAHHHKDVYAHSLKVVSNAISLEEEYLGGPDLTIRLAALLHDIAKPQTRRFGPGNAVTFRAHDVVGAKVAKARLQKLKYDKDTIKSVAKLVELHMRFYGYGDAAWTDSAVRRYAHDAGEELARLHVLTRSDVTTQNQRKAQRLAHAYDDIEQRINQIREKEQFEKIRPDLDGFEIMELLGLKERGRDGAKIGKAYKFLLQLRIDNGPSTKEHAKEELLTWAKENL